ncbi:MAG: tRNA dihydrouridine synthase [Candidatus Helarchaeota archaeon]
MRIKTLILRNKTILAPLANFSDHAFRILCLRFQAALVFTQKFHINAIVNEFKKLEPELRVYPEEHPISLQLIGNDPKVLRQALDLLESYDYDAYDLNLGWPDPEAFKTKVGAALLRHPDLIKSLLNTMVNATNKPISAKIRIGLDHFSINALEIARLLEDAGAAFLTIHGRTARAGYSGKINFSIIRAVKAQVNIPVVGNGNIIDGPSATRMLKETHCDLLMIGRAAMKNPRIFLKINSYLNGEKVPPLSLKEYERISHEFTSLQKHTNSTSSSLPPFKNFL